MAGLPVSYLLLLAPLSLSCIAPAPPPQVIYIERPARETSDTSPVEVASAPAATGSLAIDTRPSSPAPRASPALSDPASSGSPAIATASVPVSVAPAPALLAPGHPLRDCEREHFVSGWIKLRCGTTKLVIYDGFSAGPSPDFIRKTAEDFLGAYESLVVSPLAGKDTTWKLTARQRKTISGPFGDNTAWDPEGRIFRRALFTKTKVSSGGKTGLLCYADVDSFQEKRCRTLLRAVVDHGVPGGSADNSLRLAGVTVKMPGKRCWAPEAQEVHCYLDGGLSWARGDAEQLANFRATQIDNTGLAPRTDAEQAKLAKHLNDRKELLLPYKQIAELQETGRITTEVMPTYQAADIEQLRMTRHPARCTIGDRAADCERIDYYGVLDFVVQRQYFATLPDSDRGGFISLSCRHASYEAAPAPCQEIFGAFTMPSEPKRW